MNNLIKNLTSVFYLYRMFCNYIYNCLFKRYKYDEIDDTQINHLTFLMNVLICWLQTNLV